MDGSKWQGYVNLTSILTITTLSIWALDSVNHQVWIRVTETLRVEKTLLAQPPHNGHRVTLKSSSHRVRIRLSSLWFSCTYYHLSPLPHSPPTTALLLFSLFKELSFSGAFRIPWTSTKYEPLDYDAPTNHPLCWWSQTPHFSPSNKRSTLSPFDPTSPSRNARGADENNNTHLDDLRRSRPCKFQTIRLQRNRFHLNSHLIHLIHYPSILETLVSSSNTTPLPQISTPKSFTCQ